MRVVEAVDQVQVTGTARPRADGKLPRDLRLPRSREGRGLLVAHVQPANAAGPLQCVRDAVQAVAHDAVDPLDLGVLQSGNQKLRDAPIEHEVLPEKL